MPLTRIKSLGITDGAIVAADIASGAITSAKLASGVGGKLLQYKYASTSTPLTVTTNTLVDVGITVSITPTSASNKIYINVNCPDNRKQTGDTNMPVRVYRQINGGGYSNLGSITTGFLYQQSSSTLSAAVSGVLEDSSHNTTNQIDYKIYISSGQNVSQIKLNVDGDSLTSIIAYEVAA